MIFVTLLLLIFLAFWKDQRVQYQLNAALSASFSSFKEVNNVQEWWTWTEGDLQDIIHDQVSDNRDT